MGVSPSAANMEFLLDRAKHIHAQNDGNFRLSMRTIVKRQVDWREVLQDFVFSDDDIARVCVYIDWRYVAMFHPITQQFFQRFEHELLRYPNEIGINRRVSLPNKLALHSNLTDRNPLNWDFTIAVNLITLNEAGLILSSPLCTHDIVLAFLKHKAVPQSMLEYIIMNLARYGHGEDILRLICSVQRVHVDFVERHAPVLDVNLLSSNNQLCSCVATAFRGRLIETASVQAARARRCATDTSRQRTYLVNLDISLVHKLRNDMLGRR